MCRFNLINIYKLGILENYDGYQGIEPNMRFYSDARYDVFKYLQISNRIYGVTVNINYLQRTARFLYLEAFIRLNKNDIYKSVNESGAFQWLAYNLY